MAKKKSGLPEDIKRGIVKLADATKKDPKTLVEELKQVMQEDEACKTMEQKEAKIRFAWTIVASRYSISDGNPCFIKPVYTPSYRKTKKSFVGDMACILQKITIEDDGSESVDDEVFYARGTFWRDGAKALDKLRKGKTYRATLRMKDHKFGIEISGDNPNFKQVDPETCELPDLKEFYEDTIKLLGHEIFIDEMDINTAEYPTDVRVLRATILKSEEGENERGEYAYYDVVDDSILGKRTQRVYIHPNDIEHGQSSIVHFIGTVRKQDETYRWEPHFDIAEYSIPRMIIPKKIDEEAEDIDLDEDEADEEVEETEEEQVEESEDEDEEEEPEPKPKKKQKPKSKPKPIQEDEEDDEEESEEGDLFEV